MLKQTRYPKNFIYQQCSHYSRYYDVFLNIHKNLQIKQIGKVLTLVKVSTIKSMKRESNRAKYHDIFALDKRTTISITEIIVSLSPFKTYQYNVVKKGRYNLTRKSH